MKQIFTLIILCISLTASAQLGGITIPSGHSSGARDLKLDASGKYLFSAEFTKVIMWDLQGTQLYTFPSYAENFYDYAVSPDGKQLVITSEYQIVSYNTVNGKQLWQTSDLTYYKTVIFSNDGSTLLGVRKVAYDYDIDLIDPKTGAKKGTVADDEKSDGVPKFFKIDDSQIALTTLGALRIISNDFKITTRKTIPNKGKALTYLPGRKQLAFTYEADRNIVTALYSLEDGKTAILWQEGDYDETPKHLIGASSGDSFLAISQIASTDTHEAWLFSGSTPTQTLLSWRFKGKNIITGGIIDGTTGKSYLNGWNEIVELNVKSGKPGQIFKREVADLGSELFNSSEYKYTEGKLNIMTEDSLYKSIDLFRMKPYRHVNTSIGVQTVAFSPSGDTVAVFRGDISYLKNTVTGKKILSVVPGAKGASVIDPDCFFFNKSGTQLFFLTFSVPTQKRTLKSYNLVTKALRTVAIAGTFGTPAVHPDKTIMAYIDGFALTPALKVINLETGAVLMDLKLAKDKGGDHVFLSADKKQILLTSKNSGFNYYRVADGKLIIPPDNGKPKNWFPRYSTINANLDLSIVVTGDDKGGVDASDNNGSSIFHKQVHEAGVRSIMFSPDNKIIYTVSRDQTIKVLRAATGEILGTLYLFNDGNDYVFVGVDGRFDGSDGGIKRLYYIKNREKISLDLVYEKFYTPNLYQRLVNGEVFDPIDDNIKIAPQVRIAYAEIARNLTVEQEGIPTYQNTTGAAAITVNASAPDDTIEEIRLFHNGKIVNLATRGLFVTDNASGNETKTYTVNLLPGINNFRAVALNSQRTESKPDEIAVNYNTGAPAPNIPVVTDLNKVPVSLIDKNATLHLIVVGINKYQNEKMSLNYALADATAFKDEAELGAKTVITTTKTYFVTDDKANKDGIVQAFAEVQKAAKPQDVFVFYYAGHGVISQKNKEFYLVPTDVTDLKNMDDALAKKGIPSKLLQQYAIDIAAQKQVFILDACQSAGAFEAMLAADGNQQKSLAVVARSTGTHWIAASGSQQFANEFSQLGHGAFTYVLLQGLKGEAAANKMITVNGLKNFLQTGVPALMKKYNGSAQLPASYGLGNDFPVEVMK
ncbi:MAG: caspase family protein [Flavobacterium sp.]|nr:caspase family protein [Pedobacter sp.]